MTVDNGKRQCPKCRRALPLDDFPRKGKHRDGDARYGYCKSCHSAYQRQLKLARVFGITVKEYDMIMEHQGGVCAICQRPPANNRLNVDHRHQDGLIRGLVCWIDNRVLGYFRDDPERFLRAIDYLAFPPAVDALGREVFGRRGRTTARSRPPTKASQDRSRQRAADEHQRKMRALDRRAKALATRLRGRASAMWARRAADYLDSSFDGRLVRAKRKENP